ncbi:filamin-A isoform X1 [Octopus sinensis]|uniref:Filamin-A isoform X1 n=1 Tax=Octopus sinensis TaxID=2607531 RepID=A0A6P7T837_9MOLL|nr:filamin-A isoform X1 [Octopus sinensis]
MAKVVEEMSQDCRILDKKDGTICLEYHPTNVGRHEVLMNYEGNPCEGSPLQFLVDSHNGKYITAYGAGLYGGCSGKEASFMVVSHNERDLSVSIDGASKLDLKKEDLKDGAFRYSYMPMNPGAYDIAIKVNGKNIKGSPFSSKISGVGRKRSQIFLGNSSEYSLKVMEADMVNLHGNIKTPKGSVETCFLKKLADGSLGISSFTPKEPGQYVVNVMSGEKHINNSPFNIKIGNDEVGQPGKVKISGSTEKAIANSKNILTIDTRDAGYGGLSVAIDGPHRSEIVCTERKDNIYTIDYSPHEPGIYIINVRYSDENIAGSPFLVDVQGEPSGRLRETVEKEIVFPELVNVGDNVEFVVRYPGTNPFDMEAALTDPEGSCELCEVVDEDDYRYNVRFQPKMKGTHILSIKQKGLHLSGSPFVYSVGSQSSGGFHKVQAGGPGLEKGEVNTENVFNIYTKEAGPSTMAVSVEGPSKARITFEERTQGLFICSYKVTKPGIYGVHIKFGDEHIPQSPFKVNITPDSVEAKMVEVHAFKDRGLQVDKPSTFSVNLNGATGDLNCTLHTPCGGTEDCFMEEVDRGVYAIRVIPRENGIYYVAIRLNEAHIPDSPFAMMVGSVAADPAMLHASGDGLDFGKTGVKNKFLVRTAGSGSGLLAIIVEGPSKVALSCKEVDDGYEFSHSTPVAGKYMMNVKYGGVPIAGSPFLCEITESRPGAGHKPCPFTETSTLVIETVDKKIGHVTTKKLRGDATKVLAKGAGLKKAFNNRVVNINLDVKDAGHGMLNVGMVSEKGNPPVELAYKASGRNAYALQYKVNEPGDHTLSINWGDEPIPGSPFCIHC